MTNFEIPQHITAMIVLAGGWLYITLLLSSLRANVLAGYSSLVITLQAIFLPFFFPVVVYKALSSKKSVKKNQGYSLFGEGYKALFSLSALLAGLVLSLVGLVASFSLFRYHYEIEGEQLQIPVLLSWMLISFFAGILMSVFSRRVSFLEALWVISFLLLLPIFADDYILEMFSFGSAAAYFAAVIIAGALLSFLMLILGGSFGYMIAGDRGFQWSFAYENWIARRFLMGKESGSVVGTITVISVLAVGVGTCAMIVVMSVMNGFTSDLRAKIFGANAHLIVSKVGKNSFTDYEEVREKTRNILGIRGASPYALSEVMISSDVQITGALLKGIDIATINEVNTWPTQITNGRLEYLKSPDKIEKSSEQARSSKNRLKKLPQLKNSEKNKGTMSEMDALRAAVAGTPSEGKISDQKQDGQSGSLAAQLHQMLPKSGKGLLPGIIIGKEMSYSLKVFVGDTLQVVSPKSELGPNGLIPKSRSFRVAAIFHTGMYEYDSKFVYINLSEAQDFFELEGSISGLEYNVFDVDDTKALSRKLLRKIGGYPYRSRDWMDMNRNLFSALKLEKIVMFIILAFIILVASFLIAATLIVFVIEKSKEIAILKSSGATNTSIMKIFVIYGLIVGSLGSLGGLSVGLTICYLVETFGIGLDPDVYSIENLPVQVNLVECFVVSLAAILLSFLATIYPSLLAARLEPVEGLRMD